MIELTKARMFLLHKLPYLASLAFAVRVRETDRVPTAAVTERGVLYVNPAFWGALSDRQRAFVLGHELLHLVLQHAARRGERDPGRWNVAADIVVNEALFRGMEERRWPLEAPQGEFAPLRGAAFGIQGACHLTAEEVYERLPRSAKGACGLRGACGSGAGGEPLPADLEEAAGLGEAERAVLVQKTLQEMRGCGNLPGSLAREVDLALSPKVDWHRVLRAYVRGAVAHALGKGDFTFKRPSRRSEDVVLPSLRSPRPRACVVVDTSGSMGERELARALAEVEGLLREVTEVEVLSCDAEVHARGRVRRRGDARALLRGGGGTDMRVGLEAALARRPDLVVVLTDGITPWPEHPPRAPVIVVLLGDGQAPKWARVVKVEE